MACQEIVAIAAVKLVIGFLLVVSEMFVSNAVKLDTGQHSVDKLNVQLVMKMKKNPLKIMYKAKKQKIWN